MYTLLQCNYMYSIVQKFDRAKRDKRSTHKMLASKTLMNVRVMCSLMLNNNILIEKNLMN